MREERGWGVSPLSLRGGLEEAIGIEGGCYKGEVKSVEHES